MKTNIVVRMILMAAMGFSPSVFAQLAGGAMGGLTEKVKPGIELKEKGGIELYIGGKSQQPQGGVSIYSGLDREGNFYKFHLASPYAGIEAGHLDRTEVSGDGHQGFGYGVSYSNSEFNSTLGPNLYFSRQFGTRGKAVSVMVSPLRLLQMFLGSPLKVGGLGGEIKMDARAPFSNSIRALLSGSILKSYTNSDIDFLGQASLEFDLSKHGSINVGVGTEAAMHENNSSITGTKIVQSLSTGPMLRVGLTLRNIAY